MVMFNGSGEALSGYSITNGVLGVAIRLILFLSGRGVLVYGWIFINGLLNGMVLRTVQPQNTMRFILHIPTELSIGLIFIPQFICRGVLALEAEKVFGIF